MKKIIVFIGLMILITGCSNKTEAKLTMECKKTLSEVTVKEKDKLSCQLLSTEYIFTIDKITDTEMTISTSESGLSSGSGILESEKKWIIKKGSKVNIHTNSTDYQEYVSFNW